MNRRHARLGAQVFAHQGRIDSDRMPCGYPGDVTLARIAEGLRQRFGIGHSTIHVEDGTGGACALEPDHVV